MIALLVKQFNEAEFRAFLTTSVGPSVVQGALPAGATMTTIVFEAVNYLVRHGLVTNEFFNEWTKERPKLKNEIRAFERQLAMRGSVFETEDLSSIEQIGDPNSLRIVCKVKGPGFVKSTKAMEVPGGCIVQISTKEGNPDGSFSVAEALSFVPSVRLTINDDNKSWRFIKEDAN